MAILQEASQNQCKLQNLDPIIKEEENIYL